MIGAGPAGCLAALLLALQGRRVYLIEQHASGRDKVCGECLSALGVAVLRRCGLGRSLNRLGGTRLTKASFFSQSGPSFTCRLPRPMLGLSRRRLDGWLLAAARAQGVQVLQPARCAAIAAAGGGPVNLTVRRLPDNAVEQVAADFVVVADGRPTHSPGDATKPADFGIKAHFSEIAGPRDCIELYAAAGRYGGLAPIEDGLWNAAFSVSAEQLRAARGDVAAVFADLLGANAALAKRLRGARRVGPWLASPLWRHAPQPWPHRITPVGNAAAAIEPIGGEGMGLALRSAELAAAALASAGGAWTKETEAELLAKYRRLWRSRALACRMIALGVMSPWFGPMLHAAQAAPGSAAAAMWLAGK